MGEGCRAEVIQLHRFFEDWFNGRLEPTEENFRRFSSVIAEGFQIVLPNGQKIDRAGILSRVRAAHGAHAPRGPAIQIWIDAYRCRRLDESLRLVTYQEWQKVEGPPRGRFATAVLRRKKSAPHGVEWLHVNEVWLPPLPVS
ncbi:MAG: hypothetical protein ACE5HU_07030 [Acidobacteriota bacterium]